MNHSKLQNTLLRNALSNYLRTGIAMVVGLVTFRLLYQYFDKEEFGFWSLLWSVFGFGVLLDFGLGFAAQKRVAELSVNREWTEMSRVLSSILVFYVGVAAALAVVIFVASPFMVGWFGVSAARTEEFRTAMVIFFVGIGLSFPLGIFPEILRGQQRISLANWLVISGILSRLVLLLLAVHFKWGFTTVMAIALGCTLAPDFLAAFWALKGLPEVKLSLRAFELASMRHTMKFSIYAYLGAATNLVLARLDQLVITTTLGVTAVVLYQAGGKVAEMFRDFTRQVQDTLSPAAAHLHASGDRQALRRLMLDGTRWSVLIGTPLFLLCAFYLDDLLVLLTGDKALGGETVLVGHVLLIWYYVSIITHSVSKRIFVMTGHERRLMWLGAAEAVANLVLSVSLAMSMGSVVGVAIGSLLPTLWFGCMHLVPWMAKESNETIVGLLRNSVMPGWSAVLPAVPLLLVFRFVDLAPEGLPLLSMLGEGAIIGIVAIAGIWRVGMTQAERRALGARFARPPQTPTPVVA